MNPSHSALLTDLYQLTMLQTYHAQGMEDTAVFEMFVRRLPEERGFLVAAGLEQALDYLEALHFTPDELAWLAETGRFKKDFIDYLARLRFTGEVHALPEGTLLFPQEPILRVTAPLLQAQLVESRLINLIHFQTLIASKAARCVLAAGDKLLVDFGLRRAHGAEAGLLAARAAYLAGFVGTATVLAGMEFNIPIFGTMAHSLIQTHDREEQAFEHFALAQPDNVVLLIDTYDVEQATHKVVQLGQRLKAQGIAIQGVRLDSGDLAEYARQVRKILDTGGLPEVTIFCSGDLDEYRVKALLENQAPIDGFGIGTRLDSSTDAPSLDCVYKLQEYAGIARRKRSLGKATWPGRKQIYRHTQDGVLAGDWLALEKDDPQLKGEPLLQRVMYQGRRCQTTPSLKALQDRVKSELIKLPSELRSNGTTPPYPVHIAPALQQLADQLDNKPH